MIKNNKQNGERNEFDSNLNCRFYKIHYLNRKLKYECFGHYTLSNNINGQN
jgi:hypothetical protein